MPAHLVENMRPVLSPAAQDAIRVWNAIGDLRPEAIPVVVGMLDIEHVDGLIERMQAIREGMRDDDG